MAIPNSLVRASDAEIVNSDSARPSRRQFLKAAGIGGAVVGVGGLGVVSWRASDQGVFAAGTGEAYVAWGEWDQGSGPITLVRVAILAGPRNGARTLSP
jgi:TAT (twin-arginine translocation) pathway-exported protein